MAGKLHVEVVTAERLVYAVDDADMVIAPGAEGVLGILPRHAPLISLLGMGEMRVKRGREEDVLTIFGGFIEVANNVVRVLADVSERAEEIDLARAEEARQRALARLRERRADIDRQRAEMALRRSTVRIAVARKRRARPAPGGPPLAEAEV
ncbi:F0F1 ATP synthase subunit epsilon [Thermomicrobium sp. 4228-Ro]|uniref:F0F1 ATP synthase subunit epsilon n=1 Tax=Thermomicrobium sp. 4228-Ro TaxID=2993937 RepID=UPI002248A93F|nr:F0F1 ATP synthase subunit epsilon [Thermomicrobium sp. 4228-Ro]MCX2727503.1 F0F1 ATP synthase subunit epsilon [Thermomicrobium sp. 4228-Ro]